MSDNNNMFEALRSYLENPENVEKMKKHFQDIQDQENRNIERIKKMFTDDASFDILVNKILEKHDDSWRDRCYKKGSEPYPWYLLYTLFDLARDEGVEIDALDSFTESFSSSIVEYKDWQFATTNGQGTVCSIYYKKELMRRV